MKKERELLLFEAGSFHITDFPDTIVTIAEYARRHRLQFCSLKIISPKLLGIPGSNFHR